MLRNPTGDELQELFEEIWQLAEQIGASDDRHWAAQLFELAGDLAEWRHELRERRGSTTS